VIPFLAGRKTIFESRVSRLDQPPEKRMHFPIPPRIHAEALECRFCNSTSTAPTPPLDIIERIAAHNHWSFDRAEEDEISISVAGGWSEYNIAFTWLAEVEALHVACAFDLKVPSCAPRAGENGLTLMAVQLGPAGEQNGMPKYDHPVIRPNVEVPDPELFIDERNERGKLRKARACERYYQAFQFVAWAGKTGPEAVMLETQGRA
jgi:hypothetical protein